jgi:hypothetical protein
MFLPGHCLAGCQAYTLRNEGDERLGGCHSERSEESL